MQTTTDCHHTTDEAALEAALEKFQGQGARLERLTRTALRVTADGPDMLEATVSFIRGWVGKDEETAATLAVGDKVTFTTYTDSKAGYVERVSPNGKTAMIRLATQTLLNGCNSGEPDALVCTPGGFAGHVEGTQRWAVEPDPDGTVLKFTLRQRGKNLIWKLSGTGTMQTGNLLTKGHHPHYDFNF